MGDLNTTGWARIPGAVARDVAEAMADGVWALLAGRGVRRDDRATWPAGLVHKLQQVRKAGGFDLFSASPAVAAVVDPLVGSSMLSGPPGWGPALVTFPQPGAWTIPHKVWHVDLPGRGRPDRVDVARLFGYASDVAPRGGATIVVEGSHELVRRMVAEAADHDAGSSSGIRKRLFASHPWFRALGREGGDGRTAQFMDDGDEIDGVRVRVAELTASAGDVVVMLPWTLHNFSMNAAPVPRFMSTHSVMRPGTNPWV